MKPESLSGGCLCGAVRYRIEEVFDAGYCHCSRCRRGTGGAVLAWAHVHAPHFKLTTGAPSRYASSDEGSRCFCGRCGSPLFFEAADGSYFSVNIGTLDEPEHVRPKVHMCVENALSWLEVDDELPRFPGNQVSHPDKRDN